MLVEQRARELGATPIARIVSYAAAGVDPMVMGLGPVPAVRRALERAGIGVEGFHCEAVAIRGLSAPRPIAVINRARDLPDIPEPAVMAADAGSARA